MCGIAGLIQKQPGGQVLARMLQTIAHRGPDGDGVHEERSGAWSIALGHRRLAIIDVAEGAQPMHNADRSSVITYNGEVYNFLDLRAPLERGGHTFRNRSDTEVVIHHIEQHGVQGVRDLNGMFAFGLWNASTRELLLARDRTGIKPLYYAPLPDGGIIFASELSALFAHDAVRPDLSVGGLTSYFFSDYVHAPETIVRSARKLAPGHTVVWRDGQLGEPTPFWQVPAPRERQDSSDEALAQELWTRLGDAVESQLVSDVPVGIFLSGGIDSSTVATLAAAKAGRRMKAFSIGFEESTFDESEYAKQVAAGLNVELVSETLHERNLLETIDLALAQLDEPLADPSLLPTYLLSRLAARHVKVVVGGDGGDELWGGYPTYRAHRYAALYANVPEWIRRDVVGRVIAALPLDHRYQSFEWKARRFTGRWDDDPVRRHLRWMSTIDLPQLPRAIPSSGGLLPPVFSARLPATSDWLQRMLALDLVTYMPGSVLTKVDRAAMAHGLEARPPFLDNGLVDWAFSLPSRYKLRGTRGKFLLKLAAEGKLPPGVIHRPKKGFGIPLAAWIRGPLKPKIADVLASSPIWDAGLLERSTFAQWNAEHIASKHDHSKPLWALFVLDRWMRRWA